MEGTGFSFGAHRSRFFFMCITVCLFVQAEVVSQWDADFVDVRKLCPLNAH